MTELAGKRILLVEDEAIIAFAVEDMLMELGCEVVGPAMHLEEAEALARQAAIDAAILDVNINDARSYPIAELLEGRGVPFLFASGYDLSGLQWNGSPTELLAKPYRKEQIRAALEGLLSRATA
jgi:DNA-binding response OmpR family regulator